MLKVADPCSRTKVRLESGKYLVLKFVISSQLGESSTVKKLDIVNLLDGTSVALSPTRWLDVA